MPLDKPTIRELLKEAKVNSRASTKLFRKYDNHEDMAEMEHWDLTIEWLGEKLR